MLLGTQNPPNLIKKKFFKCKSHFGRLESRKLILILRVTNEILVICLIPKARAKSAAAAAAATAATATECFSLVVWFAHI